MIIYLSGPYTATEKHSRDENVLRAGHIGRKLWKMGSAVITPQFNTYGFGSIYDTEREAFAAFLVGDFELISVCDAVVMIPGWELSRGASAEFVFAKYMKIPVYEWPDLENEI